MNKLYLTSFCGLLLLLSIGASRQRGAVPIYDSELIFPLEHWHNHASTIVECPNGDLLVCWFHGSGERTADDVKIEGARLRRGSKAWSKRFTLADTPDYPDTNPTMFIDPQQRLWLMWPTILANEWHTALMKYRISSDYQRAEGPPRWDVNEVLHVTPGPEFEATVGPEAGAFHYPSIIQSRDGSLHSSYSYHLNKKNLLLDAQGEPAKKSIKHVHFNEEWVIQGDSNEKKPRR